MKKNIRIQLCIILASMLTISAAFSALAETNKISLDIAINNTINSLEVNYSLDGDTVIETTTLLDIDNSRVDMWRSIKVDGTGTLIVTKSGNTSTTELSNQDYNMFVKLVNAEALPQTRGSTIGSDLVGSQYKHVYIASNSATIDNSQLSQIALSGVGTATSIIIGLINVPAGVATSIATFLVTAIATVSPAKVIINQTVNEVHFSYDNVYYTHCYHETIKAYDTGGHLVDTTLMYKQVVGG